MFGYLGEDATAWIQPDVVEFQCVQPELVTSVQEPARDRVGEVHVTEFVVLEIKSRLAHGDNPSEELRLNRDGGSVYNHL